MNKSKKEIRLPKQQIGLEPKQRLSTSATADGNTNVGRSSEYILCSAIWIDDGVTTYVHQPKNIKQGFVVAGRRHHNCLTTLAMLQGIRKERRNKDEVQGFLTNTDRFVDRKEALHIAVIANQVIERKGGSPYYLYSEDVW